MELPVIKIPEITLPFDIPVLLHPSVDHFIIALPIIILLLEIINLFTKKRAIGVVSFFLIILMSAASVAAYYTGVVDGKEAWDLLSQAGQSELKDHKVLGTYLMLASGVVLLFKLLSSMLQRGMMKGLYLFILILFVVGILKQGKDGGELVYKYGANVEKVNTLDNELFDVNEELEELKEEILENKAAEVKAPKVMDAVTKEAEEVKENISTTVKTAVKQVEEKIEDIKEVVETVENKTDETKENNLSTEESIVEDAKKVVEKTETKVEEFANDLLESAVEVVPTPEVAKVEIATH